MAKTETAVVPKEAELVFAGVILHALISSGVKWSKDETVKYCFELGDEMAKEARRRYK